MLTRAREATAACTAPTRGFCKRLAARERLTEGSGSCTKLFRRGRKGCARHPYEGLLLTRHTNNSRRLARSLLCRLPPTASAMGAVLSMCAGGAGDIRVPIVLLVGLDGTGTTTILYQIKHGQKVETLPTLGCNKELVTVSGMEFELYDVGGLEKVRALWRTYSKEANGVAFVVDASDMRRLPQAAEELKRLFFGDRKKKSLIVPDIPLLVFANKMDVEGALSVEQIEAALDLQDLPVRRYKVLPSVAAEARNLPEGFQWMVAQLREYGY